MKKLFETGYIGKCRIKNRVAMTSMTTGFAGKDGQPTELLMDYYEERAKGGVGVIFTEIFCLNEVHGRSFPRQLMAIDPANIVTLNEMTTRIHRYDAKIIAQLHHGGSTNYPHLNKGPIKAASAIPNAIQIMPEPLTIEEIEELKQQFITTAVNCQTADFDGVEIHGAHGYLLNQFFSSSSNNRTDQYGGSLENRCRLACEIIAGIKAACGKDYPVTVRLSVDEYDPFHPNHIKLEEGVEIAKIMEAAGADAINVSCGNYFSIKGETLEPYSYPQGWKKGNAKAVKDAVNIPVIAINTVKEPEFAETLLEEGICDFVGVARGNLADPEWTIKAATGRSAEIRKCIGCMYCFESLLGPTGRARCSVNPRLGLEHAFKEAPEKNGNGKKIVVVGGGPSGMQAASILANRGFAVTLFDKGSELGGSMNLADKTAEYKNKITWLRDTLALEVEKSGVDVRLNTEVTIDMVAAEKPDAVFLSMGADPLCPNLPGLDGPNVVLANDLLSGKKQVSGKVAVIGGGLTGLETAEYICHNCNPEKLYIADMLPQLGTGIYYIVLGDVMRQIEPYAPGLLPGHKLDSVTENSVTLIRVEDQTPVTLDVDYVVLALGLKPNAELIKQYEDTFSRVVVLGESRKAPGRIATSLYDAYVAAYAFNPEA